MGMGKIMKNLRTAALAVALALPSGVAKSAGYGHLDKDAPVSRMVQRIGTVKSRAILGGLHHHYVRIVFATHN